MSSTIHRRRSCSCDCLSLTHTFFVDIVNIIFKCNVGGSDVKGLSSLAEISVIFEAMLLAMHYLEPKLLSGTKSRKSR